MIVIKKGTLCNLARCLPSWIVCQHQLPPSRKKRRLLCYQACVAFWMPRHLPDNFEVAERNRRCKDEGEKLSSTASLKLDFLSDGLAVNNWPGVTMSQVVYPKDDAIGCRTWKNRRKRF